jgi:hypothetical protein
MEEPAADPAMLSYIVRSGDESSADASYRSRTQSGRRSLSLASTGPQPLTGEVDLLWIRRGA